MPTFYEVSNRLLERRPDLFVKTQAHDPQDSESADLLWIEVSTDPSDLCEGEVILISHYGDQWFASHDSADKVGGWPTLWSAHGSSAEITLAVLEHVVGIALDRT